MGSNLFGKQIHSATIEQINIQTESIKEIQGRLNLVSAETVKFYNGPGKVRTCGPVIKSYMSVDGLYNLCSMMKRNSKMMELGSLNGESTFFFWKSEMFEKIYAVDPFKGLAGQTTDSTSLINGVVKPSNGVVEHWNMLSNEAIPKLPDNFLDLVYIDADHSFEAVFADITDIKRKMKKGGIISGHDYHTPCRGVMKAVDQIFGKPDKVFTDSSWMVTCR